MTLAKKKHFLSFGAAFLSTALIMTNSFASEEVGKNAAVKGDVTIKTPGQAAKQALIGQPVFLDDLVNSAHLSSLQVLLLDETVFTVGPDCELVIDKFVYDPNAKTGSLAAKVSKGAFRFMSGNISKSNPKNVNIETPVASMGIRGTMVEGLVGQQAIDAARQAGILPAGITPDPTGASLFALRGPGPHRQGHDRVGEIRISSGGKTVVLDRPGFAVFVASANLPPFGPFRLGSSEFAVFNQLLRTRPTGGPDFRPFTPPLEPIAPQRFQPDLPAGQDGLGDNPGQDIDWPIDDQIDVPDCTPQTPGYPNCL